jgi:hypothetical protein
MIGLGKIYYSVKCKSERTESGPETQTNLFVYASHKEREREREKREKETFFLMI